MRPDPPDPLEGVNTWGVPLWELGRKARSMTSDWTPSGRQPEAAQYLFAVLQARATLEAAERSDRTARRLVFATWALVAATLALVIVDLVLDG